MGERPHASVVLKKTAVKKRADAQGDGPVDATFKAIESIARSGRRAAALFGQRGHDRHRVAGRGHGASAKGGRIVNGVGADTDIVVASAKAYISALNKLESKIERLNPYTSFRPSVKRRTWLFVPGADPAAHRAAARSGADVVVLELEDFTAGVEVARARTLARGI